MSVRRSVIRPPVQDSATASVSFRSVIRPATFPASDSSPLAKIYFPSLASTLDPASRSFSRPRPQRTPAPSGQGGSRKVRVETDPDPEARKIHIGHRLVHRRLGSPKSLKVSVSTCSAASGNAFRRRGSPPREASAGPRRERPG